MPLIIEILIVVVTGLGMFWGADQIVSNNAKNLKDKTETSV